MSLENLSHNQSQARASLNGVVVTGSLCPFALPATKSHIMVFCVFFMKILIWMDF